MGMITRNLPVRRREGELPVAPPTPFPRMRRVALAGNGVFGAFIIGLGVWSVFAPLESAATAAGVVESESSRKTIQHLEGGIVREILVRDGDEVAAGQALLRLDDTRPRTQLHGLRGQLFDAQAREARLLAERDARETFDFPADLTAAATEDPAVAAVVEGQRAVFESRREVIRSQEAVIAERSNQVENEIAGLRAQESAARQRLEIIREEIATVQDLVDKGLTTKPRLLTLQRELVDVEGRRGEAVAQIARAHQVIAEARANLLNLQSDRHNEVTQSLYETQNLIVQLTERMQAAADQLARTEVVAPENGIVTDLRIRTPGGVVGAGASLMEIIPRGDRLVVNARLRPEDIDVVRVGQPAEVHLLASRNRRAPPLEGTVVHLSADRLVDERTEQAYYAMTIRVEDERARGEIEMVPGMPVQVFIKTGESTVALYAINPLLDTINRAFREN
ncbi:MAG TPA: HlyD family type I secretion periplasmic adaptor subunit [Saliniramus sp.]|nr:HlyD family type I secretion periplasmic adaptor subunit [Saliniramus sp.]